MADETLGEGQGTSVGPAKPRSGLLRIITAVAFVSVIVVVELVVASVLTPTAQETERLARDLAAAAAGESAGEHGHHGKEADGHSRLAGHDLHEVELGVFNITRYNPTTNTTLAIDFELYGTVLAADVSDFEHHFEHSTARIREQVTMTMHGVQSSDLTDPGLWLIKRQILEKTNRALGEPLLKEVLISKFNFVER